MKTIQVVLDEELLSRVDRVRRKQRVSRSSFIRESVERALASLSITEMVEAERRAYARKPSSADERAALKALQRAQEKALSALTDRW